MIILCFLSIYITSMLNIYHRFCLKATGKRSVRITFMLITYNIQSIIKKMFKSTYKRIEHYDKLNIL